MIGHGDSDEMVPVDRAYRPCVSTVCSDLSRREGTPVSSWCREAAMATRRGSNATYGSILAFPSDELG